MDGPLARKFARMLFRNLTLFRLPADSRSGLTDLDQQLAKLPLRPCGPLEFSTRGFVSPLGSDDTAMTRTLGHSTLFRLGQEDKLLPASVVAAEVTARARAQAEQQGRPVGGRARRQIKQEVLDTLLPRAFSRPSQLDGYIDHKQGWLVLDTASRKAAEGVVTALREALDSFPALPLTAGEAPRARLTDWLTRGKLPDGLELTDECELRDAGSTRGAVVRCRNQPLVSDEIQAHLSSGKQVFQLGLEYAERMRFVLGEDLVVRKLKFHEAVVEELAFEDDGSGLAELDARFALMTLELEQLLGQLAAWFGIEDS